MLVIFLISWANSILSPTVLVPVYDPTKSTQKFPFLCIFTSMLSFVCLITDNIRGMKVYLIAILTCIALSVCDVQHLFMHQLDVYVFSLEKCLFRLFAHFLIEMDFFFLAWVVKIPCIFWIWIPYRIMWFENISSHSVGWLFILWTVSFAV